MSTTALSVPLQPTDPEIHKTIDSFAAYVAKNGPQSEETTRQQQRDNPKFSFLFGNEFYDYYKYRLLIEIQNLQQMPIQVHGFSNLQNQAQQIQPASSEVLEEQKIEQQIKILRNQITESESNLKAHEVALNSQKQAKVEALWRGKEDKRINDLIKQVGLNIAAFDKLLDRLQESGSKESISNSKKWIFDNCNSDRLREIILTYLLHRTRERTATYGFRLHILYLINDWAHYCQRKKLDGVKQMLSRYVPKLFTYAYNATANNEAYIEKLEKLVGVWEGHKYFDDSCYKQFRNPAAMMVVEQNATAAEQQQLVIEIDKEIAETLGGYTKQHKDYEQHILTKVAALETQLRELRDKIEAERQRERRKQEEERERAEQQRRRSTRFDQQISQPMQLPPHKIPSLLDNMSGPSPLPMQSSSFPQGPGKFPPIQMDLIPKAPYYELPAGMIVSLIKLDDINYKPLKEDELRLPPREQPSEQLMREIDRFYSALQLPPAIDCVRDADGWEMNGLLEHYLKKTDQRVKLETKMKEEGKSLEDAFVNKFIPQATQRCETENGDKRSVRSRSTSVSSTSSSDSGSSSQSSNESSSSSSKSSKLSRSPSPLQKRRRQSRSVSPEERPSFGAHQSSRMKQPTAISFKIPPMPLNRDTNRGAQLMTKMGWEGKGLGAREQGMEEPITGGEVREKTEQYRGLGSQPDIYEEYRKQMSSQMAKKLHKF